MDPAAIGLWAVRKKTHRMASGQPCRKARFSMIIGMAFSYAPIIGHRDNTPRHSASLVTGCSGSDGLRGTEPEDSGRVSNRGNAAHKARRASAQALFHEEARAYAARPCGWGCHFLTFLAFRPNGAIGLQ